MKKNILLMASVGLLLLGAGCNKTSSEPNRNSTASGNPTAPSTSKVFSNNPSNPAGVYSGFSTLSFGRIGGKQPYAITILSPNQKSNTDPEKGLVASNSESSCINNNRKVVMEQLIKLDRYFTTMDFWDLPDTIGTQQLNTEEGSLFIEVDSDAGKKKVVLAAGNSNDVFDKMYKDFVSMTTKPGCDI